MSTSVNFKVKNGIDLGIPLTVANGGTGQTTALNSLNALLPLQTGANGLYLTSNGTIASWAAVAGSGTVTSISGSGGTSGLTLSGGPITTAGTLTLGGTLVVGNGGTGLTTLGSGLQVLRTNAGATAMEWATAGSGTVTSMTIVSANGFAGSVATATTTPAVTLTTTISGVLKGNGTSISAAISGLDYSGGTSVLGTGILKSTTSTGTLTIAVAGDFPTLNQSTSGNAANVTGIVAFANGGTGQTTATLAINALLPSQTGANGLYLTSNGTDTSWVAVAGSGTVTSISGSGGTTGLTLSGGPITTAGTLTLGGALVFGNGGTGLTTLGSGLQVLRTNTGATAMEWATVSGGSPAGVDIIGDAFFNIVRLMLHFDGTNGSSTVTDSSSHVKTVTVNGGTISTTQSKFGVSSYSSTPANNLTLDGSIDYHFGIDDFTIEMWIYPTTIANFFLYDGRPIGSTGNHTVIDCSGAGFIRFSNDSGYMITSGVAITANNWYHIAVSRTSGNTRLFQNGTQVGSTYADTTNYRYAPDRPMINGFGFNPGNNLGMTGYIDEVRVTNGISRYSSNFSVATSAFADTAAHIHSIQYNSSGVFGGNPTLMWDSTNNRLSVNKSAPAEALDVVGNIAATGSLTLGIGAVGNITATGSLIVGFGNSFGTITATGSLTLGTPLSIANGGTGQITAALAINALLPSQTGANGLYLTSNGTDTSWATVPASGTVTSISGSGGTTGLTLSGGPITTAGTLTLGGALVFGNGGTGLTTLGSGLQVLRTNAGATAMEWATSGGGSVPAGTPQVAGDVYYSSVSLLLHCNGTNGSTTFTDNSSLPKTITPAGNAAISTIQSKFGGASYLGDGTGDYLSTPATANLNLTTGDWTIECWIYPTNVTTSQQIIGKDGVFGASYPQYALTINASSKFTCFLGNGNGISPTGTSYTGTTNVSINTWHHLVVVKSGTTCMGFLDGNQEWSAAAATMYEGNKPLYIGTSADNPTLAGTGGVIGHIDEVRITKGIARYTTTFTPPVAEFLNVTSLGAGSIQYNINGEFGGSPTLTWDGVNNRLGVNQANPAQVLDVVGNITTTGSLTLGTALTIANGGTGQTTATLATNALLPSQASANGLYLTSNGTNTSWATVTASGITTATANTVAQRDSNADIYANNFISSSDITLKENIRAIENPEALISSLLGHRFRMISSQDETFGLIAQEVETVIPELVYQNGETKSVNYIAIIGILVEAIKQQDIRIKALENK